MSAFKESPPTVFCSLVHRASLGDRWTIFRNHLQGFQTVDIYKTVTIKIPDRFCAETFSRYYHIFCFRRTKFESPSQSIISTFIYQSLQPRDRDTEYQKHIHRVNVEDLSQIQELKLIDLRYQDLFINITAIQ